jgi:hypothetical protein
MLSTMLDCNRQSFSQQSYSYVSRFQSCVVVHLNRFSGIIRMLYALCVLWYAPTVQGQSLSVPVPSARNWQWSKNTNPMYDYTKRTSLLPHEIEDERIKSLPLPQDSVRKRIRLLEIDSCVKKLEKVSFTSVEELTYTLIALARNDYEKVWAIYRWLNHFVTYDERVYSDCDYNAEVEPEKILKKRSTICLGYANMMDLMCFYAGIQSRIIHGTTSSPKPWKPISVGALERYGHVWNHVVIEGRRYFCDATWGVQMYVLRFKDTTLCRLSRYDSFFLQDPEYISLRHHYREVAEHLQKFPLHHADRFLRFVPYGAGVHTDFKIQMPERSYFAVGENVRVDVLAPYRNANGPIRYVLTVYNHTTEQPIARISGDQNVLRNCFGVDLEQSGLYSLSLFRFVRDPKKNDKEQKEDEETPELLGQRIIVVGDSIPHRKSEYYCNEQSAHKIRLLHHNDSLMIRTDSLITLHFTTLPHFEFVASMSNNLQVQTLEPIAEHVKNGVYTVTLRAPIMGEYTCTVYGRDTLASKVQKKGRHQKMTARNNGFQTTKSKWFPVADVGISFRQAPKELVCTMTPVLISPQTEWLEHGVPITLRFLLPLGCKNMSWREGTNKADNTPITIADNIATIRVVPNIEKGKKVWFEYEYYDPVQQVMAAGSYYFHVGKRNPILLDTIRKKQSISSIQ